MSDSCLFHPNFIFSVKWKQLSILISPFAEEFHNRVCAQLSLFYGLLWKMESRLQDHQIPLTKWRKALSHSGQSPHHNT
jgi:hypothetical protein